MRCETSRFLRWRTQLHKNDSLVSRFSIYTALLDVIESRVMKRTSISYWAVWEVECGYSGSKTSQCEVLDCDGKVNQTFAILFNSKFFINITYTLYWYFCFCFQNIVISKIVGLFLLSRIKIFLWADKLLEHLSDDNLMTVPREKTSLSWLK